ncbi:unnamed protein product [Lepeophtheirus salmonis]|uniref:(salmon louse) hypothetical protein n=1 Tax=Lepeophtheirus salmonis TaxID=72036 RepID=A0A7R8CMG8_LEPSM|nr:unnamed protein product [Lepeophtheirus salmonis]CAF2863413.1 unnamed protein product [Lepeophtheirus salmonis]
MSLWLRPCLKKRKFGTIDKKYERRNNKAGLQATGYDLRGISSVGKVSYSIQKESHPIHTSEYDRLVDEVIEGLSNDEKLKDDIIISSSNFNDHIEDVKNMLRRCCSYGITSEQDKGQICLRTSKLCWICGIPKWSMKAGQETTSHTGFPTTTNISELRRFLGMCNP